MSAIVNPEVAVRAWNKLESQLCLITGHENSNGVHGGYGMLYGLGVALREAKIKCYATIPQTLASSVASTGAYNGSSGYIGGNATPPYNAAIPSSTTSGGGWLDSTNLAALSTETDLLAFYSFGKGHVATSDLYSGYYRPIIWNGTTAMTLSTLTGGIEYATDASDAYQFDRNAALTCDYWYGVTDVGPGSFRPRCVQGAVPNSYLSWASGDTGAIDVTSGTLHTMQRATRTMSAATRDQKFRTQWAGQSYLPTGYMFLGYHMTFETNARKGYVYAPFWAVGGNSTEDMAYTFTRGDADAVTDATIGHFLDAMLRPQVAASQDPFCIWIIGDTSNSASETSVSVTNGYAGSTPAAYVDNCSKIIDRVTTVWTGKGYRRENLAFLLRGDHPCSDASLEAKQVALRVEAFNNLAAKYPTQVFGWRSHEVWTPSELTARSLYYTGGGETNGVHLNDASAYPVYCRRMVDRWANADAPRSRNRGRLGGIAVR